MYCDFSSEVKSQPGVSVSSNVVQVHSVCVMPCEQFAEDAEISKVSMKRVTNDLNFNEV